MGLCNLRKTSPKSSTIKSSEQNAMADIEKMKTLEPCESIASQDEDTVQPTLDPTVVKSCVRKCDLILLPTLAFAYMLE